MILISTLTVFSVEAERRLGDDWKLSIEARAFSVGKQQDPLSNF